jgi:endonuclease/exonuclease/phosphatase family metal-dependent hydrolase
MMNALQPIAARLLTGAAVLGAMTVPTAAQTLQLRESSATTIRGGGYANTNFSSAQTVETRASSDTSYVRRIVLKFDTHNTLPQGTDIVSAHLTLTVASGSNDETRQLTAYRGGLSYDEGQTTWKLRKSGTSWSAPGGEMAQLVARQTATGSVGSRVTFDVTAAVQSIIDGTYSSTSRYARFLIVDTGASSKGSYKQFYSDEAGDLSVRPTLTIAVGSTSLPEAPASVSPPDEDPAPAPTSGAAQMRVLMWNLHHGVGTDGKYNIDRIATWMAKMTPDVIVLNEVEKYTGWGNEDQPARYKSLMQSKTGKTWYSHFSQEFGRWTSNGKGHLILSKYPLESVSHTTITASDGLNGAGAASQATIIVNGRTINFVLSHLDPYSKSMRLTQARDVIRWAAGFAENRILAGDMNAWPDQTSIAEYRKTYTDSWTAAVNKKTATAPSNITPFGATKSGRIDYIFHSSNASKLVVLASKVYDTRDSNGVMPSDHRPVVTTFEVR